MITLIGSEKGGTGKTTISVNLAVLLAKQNKDVLLIDTDQQGSASYFVQTRDENDVSPRIPCIQKFGKSLPRDVLDLAERYEEIIIDAGGRDSAELRYSLGVANGVYVPLRPSQFDVWTLDQMDKLIHQAQMLNQTLEAFVILNMASTNPATTDAFDTQELIKDYENLNIVQTTLKERVSFQRSVREGLSVIEYSPADLKAQQEITSLFNEIYSHD